jgi:ribulose-5-phosphate 4-epimerase/fuculose-1-phosphate aldolase
VGYTAFGYARKLRPEEALLRLELYDRHGLRGDLMAQAQAAGRTYGFVVNAAPATSVLRHLMLVWDGPPSPSILATTRERLGHDIDTASAVFAYPDLESSRAAVASIEAVKTLTQDRLNVIRPDRCTNQGVFVSNYKLLQTMVAETVRVRYRPIRCAPTLPNGLAEDVLPFFQAASARIADREMWSRGPYDGCVAVRCAGGVVVTATQTSKAPLQPGRLTLVHRYDEASNTITYSGPALPSADCVELMVLASRRPDLRAFVHTHASRLITRNPLFTDGVRVGVRVSGEPALGHELAEVIPHGTDTLVVLEEHGELFAGASADAEFFAWFTRICQAAGRTLGPDYPG